MIAFAGCKEDDTLKYNNITMGNIDSDRIISDQGNTFNIAESYYGDVDLSTFQYGRVIISCDVLKKTAENQYDIRLTGIASVLTKDCLNASKVTPEHEASVDDPINIREIWYGGGYINMLIEFAVKTGSESKHLINLIYDDVQLVSDEPEGESEAKYTFTLRHNGFGEVPSEENVNDYQFSVGYVSFPIADIIKEGKAKIVLNWHSHTLNNYYYNILDSEHRTKTFDWERIGYEQKRGTITPPALNCLR